MGNKVKPGVNDLATTHPKLVGEWDYSRNSSISPLEVSRGSDRKVFWLCPLDHSYDASVSGRSGRGSGCPFCAGKKVLAGFNDLATTHPEIASEWDSGSNQPLEPTQVSKASHKKVAWLCKAQHRYTATVASRTHQGSGCRICVGQKVLAGFNDLATTHPEIAAEWDFERNGHLTPEQVSKGTNRKVNWICSLEHSFDAFISARTGQGGGCPFCTGHRVLAGFNDLATTHPEIAAEWDYQRNGDLTPEQVSRGSSQKAGWICAKGHQSRSSVISRISSRGSCRRCVHRIVTKGENNLSTTHPELLEEWDFDRNTLYSPNELSRGSDQRVFWLCTAGHSFEASVSSRTGRGRGCSICVGQKVLAGFNDLATTNPGIAAEWDFENNYPLTPADVSKGSNRGVSWICHRGHSYQARTADRTAGRGCSVCANKIIISGVNDLATTHPQIAAEWDHELNDPLKPSMISRGTVKKVWWKCPLGHNYAALVSSRSIQGSGCTICDRKKILQGFNDLATTHPEIAAEWDYEKNSPLLPSQIPRGTGKSVYWLCPEGHSYRSVVGARTNIGTGCPKCNLGGFDSTQPGLFYIVRSLSLKARKVGITNLERRYDRIAAYGVEWEVMHTISNSDGQIIRDLETSVLRWIRKEAGLPQYLGKEEMGRAGGHTETFGLDGIADFELLAKIEEIYQRLLG